METNGSHTVTEGVAVRLVYPTPDRLWRVLFSTGRVVDFVAPYDSSEVRGWILEQVYPGDKNARIAGLTEVDTTKLDLGS